ncbi:MAG: hypothetical protein CL878_04550 [Dehalococcoidia bacterium]|nr:hypothetical protein [Dehalococcoidia bacterium]
MKKIARIQFHGETRPLAQAWNAAHDHHIDLGIIVLDKALPEYQQLRALFTQFAAKYDVVWRERVTAEYTQQELASFELFHVAIYGDGGEGNNTHAHVYDEVPVCDACGRVEYRQVRNLVVDLLEEQPDVEETGYFQDDVCRTDFREIVVSEQVKQLFETHRVPGVELRPVEHCDPTTAQSELAMIVPTYYQLLVETEIGPLVEPTPVQRHNRCTECGQFAQVLFDGQVFEIRSEYHFPRSSYDGAWIMQTADAFGRGPRYGRDIVINQRLYQLFQEHGITGIATYPAHIVE